MTGTTDNTNQRYIFRPLLTDFIDTDQELADLAAAGWNLKKWMERWVRDGKMLSFAWLYLTGKYHHKPIFSSYGVTN